MVEHRTYLNALTLGWSSGNMQVIVNAFGDLRQLLESELTVELQDNSNLNDLLGKLSALTRTYRKGYIGSHKAGLDLTVSLNGRTIRITQESVLLKDGDVIALYPFSVGG
jgi:molybdopterin converting factor small subunit